MVEQIAKNSAKIAEFQGGYLERALELQRKKIESQGQELSRLNRVYQRNVEATKIREAFRFLWDVIINKIQK